jgi:raffinose/stachyose/melibiose transport system permease protein
MSLVFCGPAVVLYGGFVILPAILGFTYSLTDWNGWASGGNGSDLWATVTGLLSFSPGAARVAFERFLGAHFVGFENYRELFHSSVFLNLGSLRSFRESVVGFTLYETLLIVIAFTFGSMVLAVLLDRLHRLKGLIRGLFFYPYILSVLVSGLLFMYLANYRMGAINRLLGSLGLSSWQQNWMMGPEWAPYFIFALVTWSGMGFFTTLYLANLQTVPVDLYEAARMDGAGPLAIFRHIQFPLLMPTVMTNSVLALIGGINLFPQIVVTTDGGPGTATQSIGYYVYRLGWSDNRLALASAVSFVAFAALVLVAAIQVALLRRRQVAL